MASAGKFFYINWDSRYVLLLILVILGIFVILSCKNIGKRYYLCYNKEHI